MRLTKKRALDISIELWEWMAKTGSNYKGDWPGWEKYGEMFNYCPLCEYAGAVKIETNRCKKCLLKWGAFGCERQGESQYLKWDDALTKADRKKYAGLFVKQLKEIRGD